MTPEQEAQLLETVTATNVKMNMLISDDGSRGLVPEQKIAHAILENVVSKHESQISTAAGALYAAKWIVGGIGLLVVTLAGVVLEHILKGGK